MPNIPLNSNIITRFCHSMIFGRRASEADEQWKGEKCLSMRQSFHRALTTCRAPLPPGKKYVAVQFLTKELIFYVVDIKGKGQEIFDEASKHLGLSDAELFGLAFYQDGEYIFIDLNLKVSKYAVRSWKTHTNGISGDGQPLLILHMRIKYYVDCHLLINEKIVRHHYYLQLRENVKHYAQPISEEKSFLLAALALQADLGNYNAEKHKNRYFEIANYFPSWFVKKIGEDFIVRSIPSLHKDNSGLSRGEAQVGYIQGASDPTVPHNLHLYRMRRRKGKVWGDVWLGVGDGGIHIYEEVENIKSQLSTFSWCDIAKLHFEKKKFEILSEGSPHCRRFTYFVQSEDLAKNLLWICRMTHHFHMANQSRVADLKKLELDGGKPYRESYIYTDKVDQAREKRQNTLQKNNLKSKVENSAVNFNGTSDHMLAKKSTKMSGMPWQNGGCLENGQCVSSHHSMEVLPLTNGCRFSSELKYKSQSIPCLPDCSLTPYSASENCSSSHHWCPTSNNASTTSTLMSRSSCTSNNTDSTCSYLSLASGSTLKVGSRHSNDSSHWVKCDSFEELPIREPSPEKVLQKVCISTFSDGHVRTASVYDAVTARTSDVPMAQMPNLATTKTRNGHESFQTPAFNIRTSTELNTTPNYATASLEPPPSSKASKVIDVKRSPSFNVCPINSRPTRPCAPTTPLQKPQRQYAPNSHGRTATRIGVSSLSRDQRLPLTLFNERGIMACGSEPNLYAPTSDRTSVAMSVKSKWLQRKLNSQSEMSLNVLEHGNVDRVFGVDASRDNKTSRQESLPDVCSEGTSGEADFLCIPPPPAYRNETENGPAPVGDTVDAKFSVSQNEKENDPQSPSSKIHPPTQKHPRSTSPDVLDIQQLRQRSRDLDLPLISALCNDRSLLMLPKTVPTCSRQRHLGRKDPLRFNRTTSLPNGDGLEAFLVNSGRPISWHVDSSQVPHWPEVSKPCSASWDYSIQRELASEAVPRTASLDNGVGGVVLPPSWNCEVPRPVSMDYNNHGHYSLENEALKPRTMSLENGIHQGLPSEVWQPRTVSMDYNNHPHFMLANEALRPRTISLENGLHQGQIQNQRTTSMDYNNHLHFLLANESPRPRTVSLENGLHQGVAQNLRTASMDYNAHVHYPLANAALRPRTISLENGLHQGEVQNQRTVSMDYNTHAHYPLGNEALRPRTVSLENGIYQGEIQNQRTTFMGNGIRPCLGGMSLPVSSLPPTILTSFVKTPVKQVKGFRDHSSASDSYRYDKSQMIPTKLLAGSLSSITNGRLYQKGLSS